MLKSKYLSYKIKSEFLSIYDWNDIKISGEKNYLCFEYISAWAHVCTQKKKKKKKSYTEKWI